MRYGLNGFFVCSDAGRKLNAKSFSKLLENNDDVDNALRTLCFKLEQPLHVPSQNLFLILP